MSGKKGKISCLNGPFFLNLFFFWNHVVCTFFVLFQYWAEGNETEIIPPEYHEGYTPEDIDLEILTKQLFFLVPRKEKKQSKNKVKLLKNFLFLFFFLLPS